MESFLSYYARMNQSVIDLVDVVPDDRLDWAPRPDMWGAGAIFAHIAQGRDDLLDDVGFSREPRTYREAGKSDLKSALFASWERLARFCGEEQNIARTYVHPENGAELRGAWIPYSRFGHDVHHRGEILAYLDQLGIPAADIDGYDGWGPQPHPLER